MAAYVYPPNPNPLRVSAAIWRLWNDFDRHEPPALLGGIYANKSGYHNYRNALSGMDYSVRLAADMRGSGVKASGLDISLPRAQMELYTGRLDKAARARDIRLYTAKGPVLREFIGTKNGTTVYCYVLVGGQMLGVGADAGPDPGRDESHLWHIHLSIIRQFCEDWDALSGVLSVLVGQPLDEWRSDMNGPQDQKLSAINARVEAQALGHDNVTTYWASDETGQEPQWQVRTLKSIATAVAGIAAALPGVDDAVAAQLQDDLAGLQASIEATPSQVLAQLTAVPREEGVQALIAAIGPEQARLFAQEVMEQTGE